MQLRLVARTLLLGLSLLPGIAFCTNCSNLPTVFDGDEFPTGDFFTNFNNPCYTIPLAHGKGALGDGDLNSLYDIIYYKVNPSYQLILIGSFPQARYFSVTVYDEHSSIAQSLTDAAIVPLTSQYINPYQPGVPFVSGQQYAVPINFGGTPGTLQTGCMMNGYNTDVNAMDATQRHKGMDWNSDSGFFQQYPHVALHTVDTPQHTNPNGAGTLLIRNYLDITPPGSSTNPYLIVRDVASGCAYPAAYVLNTLQNVTKNGSTGRTWLSNSQIQAHNLYETKYLPKLCFGTDPQNSLMWLRGAEFVPGSNPDSGYTSANVPANLPATLAAAGEVMRIRFRIATAPPTPCLNNCSRSGGEQMRYTSLSFENPGGVTLVSIADNGFVRDPNGYVTLIVGTGAAVPSWITQANGYTYVDLTSITGYQQLNLLELRNILPNSTFNCAAEVIPYRTLEHTAAGGLMGEYLPVVDYPIATSLPAMATPLVQANSCGMFPKGQPGVVPACGVFKPPPASISSAITQCSAPGCNQFVAQSMPPITIIGAGFGDFPYGLPFTGNSNFLEITDTTQNWDAGYGTDQCNIYLDAWASNRISIVVNDNQNAACPVAAGDQFTIKVWNPQSTTGKPASFSVTATAN